ncbi:hypothetical protein SH668x_001623 [Planctomicrobium sp. SH668]|uniref:hypothetical protein n=1 Tax=Planctomicrobium sp. SH668 TaxID=3448126 RepID=UPI003F5C414E
MKAKRVVTGGAVVGLLALGVWLANFWKGPGLGGSGTGYGVSSAPETNINETQVNTAVESPAPAPSVEVAAPKNAFESYPSDIMTIVIEGGSYRLTDGVLNSSGTPISLEEISQRAQNLTGTAEGLRVRILKEKSAQEGARSDLMQELTKNGVKREEIQERADFIN